MFYAHGPSQILVWVLRLIHRPCQGLPYVPSQFCYLIAPVIPCLGSHTMSHSPYVELPRVNTQHSAFRKHMRMPSF